MKRLSASLLALGLVVAVGTASAQSGYYPNNQYRSSTYNNGYVQQPVVDRYGNSSGAIYDYARVVRVDPVINSGYGYGNTSASSQRCYDATSAGGYGNDPYRNDGYYGNDGYSRDSYGNDPYNQQSGYGSNTGRTMATVIGGIAGAVLGSKVGGGSGTYAATAIGSMVGGMAGRQVYEQSQRNRYQQRGNVRVCDPVPVNGGYSTRQVNDGRVNGYDVTYEYAGRQFTTRTSYHPGDRIRVRVDVRPE
jgi:hypothetical protein